VFPSEMFDPDSEAGEYTREQAGCLAGAGVVVGGFLAAFLYLTNFFFPYLLVLAPVMIAVGLAGLVEPRVLGAITGRKRTSWGVYLLALVAGLGGLAVGIVGVFYLRGIL
jgi:hypothetical protein